MLYSVLHLGHLWIEKSSFCGLVKVMCGQISSLEYAEFVVAPVKPYESKQLR